MTKNEAVAVLDRAGLVGADGRTCLAHAMVGFDSIDSMLREANEMNADKVWARFGQDGGRAVLVLKKAAR